jgi:hypothetical protein
MIDSSQVQIVLAVSAILFIVGLLVMGLVWLALRGQNHEIRAIRHELSEYLDTDLQIKRAKLGQSVVKPSDPKLWINTVITNVTGGDVRVTEFPIEHPTSDPKYLLALDKDGVQYLLCSDSPDALRRLAPRRHNLAKGLHPLLPIPSGTEVYECSVRTTGNPVFDQQAALLWADKNMAGEDLQSSKLWLYVIAPKK